jgi:hypothetical protein
MKRITTYAIIALFAGGQILLNSCSKESPIVEFSILENEETLEIGRPIHLINISTKAARYQWTIESVETGEIVYEFDSISAVVTFDETGLYDVTLKAISADDEEATATKTLTIKQRKLVSFALMNISFVDADGLPWDSDDTGPDLIFTFGPVDDPNFERLIVTQTIPDVTPADLPVGWDLNPSSNYILTDEDYELALIDYDEAEEQFQEMLVLGFNPVQYIFSAKDGNGNGLMQISVDGFSVDMFFEIELTN